MPSWPSHFPVAFSPDGFSLDPVASTVPVDVESGEPMSRRRFTGDMDDVTGALPAMRVGLAREIVDFWRYDLKQGALPFSWNNPLTLEAARFLFLDAPKLTALGADLWRINFRLRRLP